VGARLPRPRLADEAARCRVQIAYGRPGEYPEIAAGAPLAPFSAHLVGRGGAGGSGAPGWARGGAVLASRRFESLYAGSGGNAYHWDLPGGGVAAARLVVLAEGGGGRAELALTEVEAFAAARWDCEAHCLHGVCVAGDCVCSSGARPAALRKARRALAPADPLRSPSAPSRPPSRTKWTRRVPHPVLIGHAASLTPYSLAPSRPPSPHPLSLPRTPRAPPPTVRTLPRQGTGWVRPVPSTRCTRPSSSRPPPRRAPTAAATRRRRRRRRRPSTAGGRPQTRRPSRRPSTPPRSLCLPAPRGASRRGAAAPGLVRRRGGAAGGEAVRRAAPGRVLGGAGAGARVGQHRAVGAADLPLRRPPPSY